MGTIHDVYDMAKKARVVFKAYHWEYARPDSSRYEPKTADLAATISRLYDNMGDSDAIASGRFYLVKQEGGVISVCLELGTLE